MNVIRCDCFIFQAGPGLIAAPESDQIDGIGECLLGKYWLVEAPVVGVGPEAMDEQHGLFRIGVAHQAPTN